MTVPV